MSAQSPLTLKDLISKTTDWGFDLDTGHFLTTTNNEPSTKNGNNDKSCSKMGHSPQLSRRNVKSRILSFSLPSVLETCIGDNTKTQEEDEASATGTPATREQDNIVCSIESTSMTKIWRFYAQESSCHGLKCVVDKRRRKMVRSAWLVIILLKLGVLICTLCNVLAEYIDHPTVTRTDVRIQTRPDFPSVTICNHSPFKNINMTEDNPIFRTMERQSILKVLHNDIGKVSAPEYMSFFEQPAQEVFETYAFTKKDLIEEAHYEGQALDVNSDLEEVFTTSGRCFTFNGPKHIAKHGVRKVNFDGRGSGLRLLINLNQDLYVPFDRLTVGIRVYVAHHPETPCFEKDGYDIRPGTSTSVALEPVQFKFLPFPFPSFVSGSCINMADDNMQDKMYNASFYSRSQCLFQCRVQLVSNACGCFTSTLLYVEGLPPCTFGKFIECVAPQLDRMRKHDPNKSCDCPRPCAFTQYNSVLSSSQLPSNPFVKFNQIVNVSSIGSIRDNFLEVRLFLSSLLLRTEVHEPQYTFISIIGVLGGQMGFFMGASLMTMAELGETLVLTMIFLIHKLLTSDQKKLSVH